MWDVHFSSHDDLMPFSLHHSLLQGAKRAFEGGFEAASPKAFPPPPLFTDPGFRVEVRVGATVTYGPCF